MKNFIKFISLCTIMLCTHVIFTGCNEDDNTWDPTSEYPELILGGWYHEGAQEHDQFLSSGVFYMKYPNQATNITGHYSVEGDQYTAEFTLDNTEYSFLYTLTTLTETRMIWKNETTGDEFEYMRVIADIELEVNETIALEDIVSERLGSQNFVIGECKALHSNVIVNNDTKEISAIIDGEAFVKIHSNVGDVVIHIQVTPTAEFHLPNFEIYLNKPIEDIRNIFGTPYLEGENMLCYLLGSETFSRVICSFDENNNISDMVILNLTGNNLQNILDELNNKYILIMQEDYKYYFVTTDYSCFILYQPIQNSLSYSVL